MTTSRVAVTEGSGKNVAGYSISEDAVTKQIQRVSLNESDGTEITPTAPGQATAANSLPVVLASDDPVVAVAGAISGAKVVTDANGTLQQYLRGLVTFAANALGAGTAAAAYRTTLASDDPAVATLGATSGAAVITDANGTIQQYLRGLVKRWVDALGAGTAAAALRVTIASDAPGVADSTAGEYETVAASQSTQTIGATGATGDYLEAVLIVPSSTSPGEVLIKDGSDTAISIFKGGATSITDLAPIYVPLGLKSRTGAWQITTGANETAIGIGNFT